MLHDSLTDYQKAPVWIGAVVGALVRVGACTLASVAQMVETMKRLVRTCQPSSRPNFPFTSLFSPVTPLIPLFNTLHLIHSIKYLLFNNPPIYLIIPA